MSSVKVLGAFGLGLVGLVACGGVAREPPRQSVVVPVASAQRVSMPQPVVSAVPAPVAVEEKQAVPEILGRDVADDFRRTPKEIVAEKKQFEERYAAFPKLRRLPDFLSVDQVVAMLPVEERDSTRDEIHQQLEGGENDALLGAILDEGDERLFALWVRGNLTQVLAVFDAGKLTGKRVISRGKPRLGELLAERDGYRLEILIERITTMSVCCLPMSLEVYRVSKRGALTQVLDFPRGHVEVGPGERWSFLNHFEFDADRSIVSSVFPGNQPTYELRFDAGVGKYVPTLATAKRLADEKREREKLKASGQLLEN